MAVTAASAFSDRLASLEARAARARAALADALRMEASLAGVE